MSSATMNAIGEQGLRIAFANLGLTPEATEFAVSTVETIRNLDNTAKAFVPWVQAIDTTVTWKFDGFDPDNNAVWFKPDCPDKDGSQALRDKISAAWESWTTIVPDRSAVWVRYPFLPDSLR